MESGEIKIALKAFSFGKHAGIQKWQISLTLLLDTQQVTHFPSESLNPVEKKELLGLSSGNIVIKYIYLHS